MIDNNIEHTINPILGVVSKALRKSKGCTLKEAAGDSFSSAHLSNFEHGKTELSAQLFLDLLDNINVSTIEFQRFYENYLRSHNSQPFSNEDISKAYMTGNIIKLEAILSTLETRYNSKKASKKSKLEIIRVKAIISLIDPARHLSENDMIFLKSYLMQLEEWGKYDIALLGQCYTNFDLGTLAILTDKMLNPSQTTITLESNQHSLIQTVLNVMTYFIENRQFDRTNRLINYLKKMNIHEYYMFEKLIFNYHIATLDYKLGDTSALETMEKCQEVLEFCGCLDNANILAKEISKLKNKIEKP